jgi:hypothetical protein
MKLFYHYKNNIYYLIFKMIYFLQHETKHETKHEIKNFLFSLYCIKYSNIYKIIKGHKIPINT